MPTRTLKSNWHKAMISRCTKDLNKGWTYVLLVVDVLIEDVVEDVLTEDVVEDVLTDDVVEVLTDEVDEVLDEVEVEVGLDDVEDVVVVAVPAKHWL